MAFEPTADAATAGIIWEHTHRKIDVNGVPLIGFEEVTGGGVVREGQTEVRGGSGSMRGLTDGKQVAQEITVKWEASTWSLIVRPTLIGSALASGIIDEDGYQKVEITLTDQYRTASIYGPKKVIVNTVKIKEEKPDTPSDGKPFTISVVFKPCRLPREIIS